MSDAYITCLFCQTRTEINTKKSDKSTELKCSGCGMTLSLNSPESASSRQGFFVKAFIGIALFCVVMMYFLPR